MEGDKPIFIETPIVLNGQISESEFIGDWAAETGKSDQAKATRQ
jgi:hypothetical protein